MARTTLVPFWPGFCKHGSAEGQRRPVPTEKPAQPSRAPKGGTWPYFPGRQYKPPHPGARAGPRHHPHWHPVTTQSPSPGLQCMHGLAYYCVPWPAIPGSLPFCFSKATTRHQLHHLTLHQESHLLSQKIIAAALPFCQTPLLPDKPCFGQKSTIKSCPFASDISECDSGSPSRRAVCGRPICPATPGSKRKKHGSRQNHQQQPAPAHAPHRVCLERRKR